MQDKAGREIQVGDFIVYGHALGRCAGLQYGKVLEICRVPRGAYHAPGPDTEKIRVQGVNWDWDWDQRGPTLQRTSLLTFPERILVITQDQVHPRVLILLEAME